MIKTPLPEVVNQELEWPLAGAADRQAAAGAAREVEQVATNLTRHRAQVEVSRQAAGHVGNTTLATLEHVIIHSTQCIQPTRSCVRLAEPVVLVPAHCRKRVMRRDVNVLIFFWSNASFFSVPPKNRSFRFVFKMKTFYQEKKIFRFFNIIKIEFYFIFCFCFYLFL